MHIVFVITNTSIFLLQKTAWTKIECINLLSIDTVATWNLMLHCPTRQHRGIYLGLELVQASSATQSGRKETKHSVNVKLVH